MSRFNFYSVRVYILLLIVLAIIPVFWLTIFSAKEYDVLFQRLESLRSQQTDKQSAQSAEIQQNIDYLRNRNLMLLGLVTLFTLIVGWLVGSNLIAKRLQALVEVSNKLAEGDLNQRLNVRGTDEVGQLGQAFNEMAAKLQKLYKGLKSIVEIKTKALDHKVTELESQKAKDTAILESIGDGLIAADNKGMVIIVNKAAETMLGWEAKDLVGKQLLETIQMEDEKEKKIADADRPLAKCLTTNKKVFGTYFYIRKNGSKVPIHYVVTPIMFENTCLGAIATFTDITKEKEIDKAKNEFVSLASHQLRTPLSTINWYAEMLLAGDAGALNEEQIKFLKELYAANQRMVDLVNALLNVSRIELGTLALEPVATSLPTLANTVIGELIPQITTKKITLEKNYDKSLPEIKVDPKIMDIIFHNLLTNAVKYTPESGKVTLAIAKKNNEVLISVTDNGCGIPKGQQSRVFSKLFRADNAIEKEADGTGLGLYIIKSVINQCEGNIWFESEENKGSTFYVTIPLKGMPKKTGIKGLNKGRS